MDNNMLLAFVSEFFQRLFQKSPKFFAILNTISVIVAIVTGLPGFLASVGIHLPDALAVLQNQIVAWAAIVALIIGKLPTPSTPVGITESGDVLKKTNQKVLPFTASSENKNATNKTLPVKVTKS